MSITFTETLTALFEHGRLSEKYFVLTFGERRVR